MRSWGKRLAPVVAVVVAAVALPLGAAPSGAAPKRGDERRTPIWESEWVTKDAYPEEDDSLWFQAPTTHLDPATGDVLALVWTNEGRLLRRIDGRTGATLSEVEVAQPDDLPTTAPGSTQQWLEIADTSPEGKLEIWASALGFDGTPLWRRPLAPRGELHSSYTQPATGTTCAAVELHPARAERGVLVCVDSSGTVLFERTLERPGAMRVIADPNRPRWYLADLRTQGRRETTTIRAFNAGGRQVWSRSRTSSVPRGEGQETARPVLTVDPKRGRVLLGSSDSRTTRIDVWTRQGRAVSTRGWRTKQWGHRKGRLIKDLVVTADGTRVFAVQEGARAQMTVVALRPNGKRLWKRRHGASDDSSYYGVYLLPAEDRKRVLVVGADVAAYDWKGKRRWRGKTDSHFLGSFLGMRGHYDRTRGRFIVPWMDQGYPRVSISAFRP